MAIDMQLLYQKSEKAPLNAFPLEAAFGVLQSRRDCLVEHLDTQHVPGKSLKDTYSSQKEGRKTSLPRILQMHGAYLSIVKSFNCIKEDKVSVT